MSETILVAGGCGFVGSHLCKYLLETGSARVLCIDNCSTSEPTNVAPLVAAFPDRFVHLRINVQNKEDLLKAAEEHKPIKQVFNLACPAAPGHYQYTPLDTVRTAVLGVMNLCELALVHGARILQASTSEVYGDPDVHPQPETYKGSVNPIGPRACYDEGKRVGETIMFDYHRVHKLNIAVIRIFNTYGPNMHPYDGRVVSNFCRQVWRGEDITVYGDGSQTRSFQFVSDLIQGIVAVMNKDGFTGPVNLGNPGEYTIKQLAEKVVELANSKRAASGETGVESKVVYKDLPKDDPKQRKPDITLAKAELGWAPVIPLDEGLSTTMDYFRSLDMDKFTPPSKNYCEPNPITLEDKEA